MKQLVRAVVFTAVNHMEKGRGDRVPFFHKSRAQQAFIVRNNYATPQSPGWRRWESWQSPEDGPERI